MRIEDRTRKEVERRLARLESEYGTFPVVEEAVTNDSDYFAHGVELVSEGWIGDAGAWITDERGRALLIRHEADTERWGTPGGGHVPGETLAGTARREVREETGVEVRLTGVYRARRKTVVDESDPERRFRMLTVWFEGEPARPDGAAPAIEVGDDEIVDARWHAEPPARVHDFLDAKMETWDGADTGSE
jgi:ADP-ribose pyrophosphatase YjhB (NUDIX family)